MISAIVMANSGRPFSVTDGFDQAGFANNSFTRSRPDAVAGCKAIVGRADQWYDPACFHLQPVGRPGNLGRNTYRAPGFVTTNLSIAKTFSINERWKIRVRNDFFNLLNHRNFGPPEN